MLAGTTRSLGVVNAGTGVIVPGNEIPDERQAGLPFFDARLTTLGIPMPFVRESLAGYAKSPEWAARQAELAALMAQITDVRVDDNEFFGTPHFIRSVTTFLTPASKLAPRDVVKAYVRNHPGLFGVDTAWLDKAAIPRDFVTKHNGVTHLSFQQQIGEIELMSCELRANVMPDGRLINISSSMIPVAGGLPGWTLGETDALRAAAANIGEAFTVLPTPGPAAGEERKTQWRGSPDFRADEPIETRRVYFPMTRTDVRAAYQVVLPVKGIGHTYEVVIDANSGQLLQRLNRLVYVADPVTFHVWPDDSPAPGSPGPDTPSGFQFPYVARQMITVTDADISAYSPLGWVPNGPSPITSGNNTSAYLDRDANNAPDSGGQPAATASRVFDFPVDPTVDAPTTYGNATAAQLFYYVNRFHDKLYSLGFDEAAHNFQVTNVTGQGVGNDPVLAEGQDGSGTNNANFSTTGTDGSTGRTQMYIFTGPNPDRDGSFDGDVVYHECGHGVSIRLHNGTLTGTQSGGMGEGWSDFWSLVFSARPGDDLSAVYTTGGWVTRDFPSGSFTNNYYFGIRRYPYSTDLNKNPETYADIDPAQISFPPGVPHSPVIGDTANEVHNVGEVWCLTLYECRNFLSAAHGFAANDLLARLVVDGMKLDPAGPNFLQARDAILQADLVNNAGANQYDLWQGFAKRGLGFSATSPAGSTSNGIVEAFDVPQRVDFSYPDGVPLRLNPHGSTTFHVNVAPFNLSLTPNSGTLSYSVNGGPFTTIPMTEGPTNTYTANLPGNNCFDIVRFYVSVGTSFGVRNSPATGSNSAMVYSRDQIAFSDDFETDTGWTVNNVPLTGGIFSGAWVRVDPNGTTAQPEDDHTPSPGTMCYVTGQGTPGGSVLEADVDYGTTRLVSPTFNLAGMGDAIIEYYRWYSQNTVTINADEFLVEVSNNNGATWTAFDRIAVGDTIVPGWVRVTKALSDVGVTPSAQVRLRFSAADLGTQNITEAAVDDFRIFARVCDAACNADYNQDGSADLSDIFDLAADVSGGTQSFPPNSPDFNSDGSADVSDIFDLAAVVAGGPCP